MHHLIPKGERGDDVYPGNIVALCGSGSSGCHGAYHGNPYTIEHGPTEVRGGLYEMTYYVRPLIERRDAEWVARRIGKTISGCPAILAYMKEKLGEDRAREYLARRYYLVV